jgi:hypothetical protein
MYERGIKGESLAARGGISEPYFGCERVVRNATTNLINGGNWGW